MSKFSSELAGRAPRVAFFTYPDWAFGSIHEALCRELYKVGIFATILDWNATYSHSEFDRLREVYDVFVTHPGSGVNALLKYGIPYSQIVAIAHEVSDIQSGLQHRNDFNAFKNYAVINPKLTEASAGFGIERKPAVVQNGIHFDWYYMPPPESLRTIGYAGSVTSTMMDGVTDRKRGHLSLTLANQAGLKHSFAEGYGYRTMPMFYKSVDAVVMTSIQEACGLPMMEAAAAGRLPVGTPVGILEQHGTFAGDILPMNEVDLVKEGANLFRYYANNRLGFRIRCSTVQDYAREHYDWSKVIEPWINAVI